MKLLRVTTNSVKILFLALALNACAGDDASTEEPIQEDGEENAANAEEGDGSEEDMNAENAGNGNNANMNGEGNNMANEGNNMGNGNNLMNEEGGNTEAPANEFVNNAAGENFLDSGNGNIAAEMPASDPTADAALAENSSDDLGIAPSDDTLTGNQNVAAGNAVPTNSAPNANMGATDASLAVPTDSEASPVPSAAAPAPTGGRVRYVKKGGATAHDKPSGSVVKNLEQGDHPLVTADGEWVRTSDGAYIQSTSLTTQPVSRAKSPKAWR